MEFKITINASPEKVWSALWDDANYRDWTTAFSPGSYAETDWKTGSKVLFLDSSRRGMVSRITENRPNEYMGITHLGNYNNGVEDLDSDDAKSWAGSYENYTLTKVDGGTELYVQMGGAKMPKDMADMFMKMWPKALDRLKVVAENL